MPVVQDMIVVEDRLEEVFNFLPSMKASENTPEYEVLFKYGDQKELNAFLKYSEGEEVRPYPLIWLVYPYLEVHDKTKVTLKNLSFVLAVDTKSAMFNNERIKESYKKVLIPLFNNFKKVLTRANIINCDYEFKVVKHPNYSTTVEGDKHKVTALWDALKVTCSITINNVCLKEIQI